MSSFEERELALPRQHIVRLETQVEFLFKHFGVGMNADGNPADDPQVIEALKKNNLIEAIRIYHEKTGVGLAEAKAAVEAINIRRGSGFEKN